MLVFVEGRERAEYVRWSDVAQVDFDRPPVMSAPPESTTGEIGRHRVPSPSTSRLTFRTPLETLVVSNGEAGT